MAKPILLTVDDADGLLAIERDLRSDQGAQYRVLASDSLEAARKRYEQLHTRNGLGTVV